VSPLSGETASPTKDRVENTLSEFPRFINLPGGEEMTEDQKLALTSVRNTLIERLKRLQIAPALLEDASVFQLVGLLHLMVGHLNYVGVYSTTCWTLEQILGKDLFFDSPSELSKAAIEESKTEELKPMVN
jgi:hypothetical protein